MGLTTQSVFLIGLMGAGKTTIGQALASRLSFQFYDSDHVLAERTGASITTIFEVEGEAAFRAREANVIDELTMLPDIVLATGGGAVNALETRQRLKSRGVVIYLHSTAETSYERIRRNRERPLLQVADPLAMLRALYDARHRLYQQCAAYTVESYRDKPIYVVNEIIDLLSREGETSHSN